MTTETTQGQYVEILHHINRYVSGGFGPQSEERKKLELEQKLKDLQEFKDFYKDNKSFVDKLESERTKNNNFSFEGELTTSDLKFLLNDENAPFPKLKKGSDTYTPSGLCLYNVLCDGEFTYGFDPFEVDGYTFTHVGQHGGEGEGDEYWVVFRVTKDGTERYFKWSGWYASYDGGHLEDIFEVAPKEVTITIYEKVK